MRDVELVWYGRETLSCFWASGNSVNDEMTEEYSAFYTILDQMRREMERTKFVLFFA